MARSWRRREPEKTVLYGALQSERRTFCAEGEAGDRSLPRFCHREVEGCLRCGILAHGLAHSFGRHCLMIVRLE